MYYVAAAEAVAMQVHSEDSVVVWVRWSVLMIDLAALLSFVALNEQRHWLQAPGPWAVQWVVHSGDHSISAS